MRRLLQRMFNDYSTIKALKIGIAEFIKGTWGISWLIQRYDEEGKTVYTLSGPLRRLGKLECKNIPSPYNQ